MHRTLISRDRKDVKEKKPTMYRGKKRTDNCSTIGVSEPIGGRQ